MSQISFYLDGRIQPTDVIFIDHCERSSWGFPDVNSQGNFENFGGNLPHSKKGQYTQFIWLFYYGVNCPKTFRNYLKKAHRDSSLDFSLA